MTACKGRRTTGFGASCSARGRELARATLALEHESESGSLHTDPPLVNVRHFARLAAGRHDERGSAVVDFVLVTLVLVPLFLGILLWNVVVRPLRAAANPWEALGVEWQLPTPVPVYNFDTIPVTWSLPYDYDTGRPATELVRVTPALGGAGA